MIDIITLVINITKPDRTVSNYGGDAVQDSFTGIFEALEAIRCVFLGLFTGNWC